MSEDTTKKVDTTTDAPAQEDKGNEVVVDYKVELEKAKKALEDKETELKKAQFTIEKTKKDLKSNTTKDDEGVYEDEDTEIEDKATKIAEVTTEKVRQEMVKDVIEEEISKRAESPEHAELLRLYYDKKIVKSGFSRSAITSDLDNAALLVNKPKLEATLKELKQKAISNGTKNTGGAVSGQADKPDETLELSDADRRIMQRFGLKESDIK